MLKNLNRHNVKTAWNTYSVACGIMGSDFTPKYEQFLSPYGLSYDQIV